jgi:hypothetical protein
MYIFGGYDGAYKNDFHEFNFGECMRFTCSHANFGLLCEVNSAWSLVNATGRVPRARYRATCVVYAGETNSHVRLSKGFRFVISREFHAEWMHVSVWRA